MNSIINIIVINTLRRLLNTPHDVDPDVVNSNVPADSGKSNGNTTVWYFATENATRYGAIDAATNNNVNWLAGFPAPPVNIPVSHKTRIARKPAPSKSSKIAVTFPESP
jgi:hypothetical protein